MPMTGLAQWNGKLYALSLDGTLWEVNRPEATLRKVNSIPLDVASDWLELWCCGDAGGDIVAGHSAGTYRSDDPADEWTQLLPTSVFVYEVSGADGALPRLYTNEGILSASNEDRFCGEPSCSATIKVLLL